MHPRTRLSGDWDAAEVAAFLDAQIAPIRLAPQWNNGVPLPVSVWYLHEDGVLWCASLRTSRLVKALEAAPRVGFEISVNDVPYRGVRGQGRVDLVPEQAEARLEALIDRYLGDRESALARWLLSRVADEVALRLVPDWLVSWDYSARMGDAPR